MTASRADGTIVVTGATGTVGGGLVRALAGGGPDVVAAVRDPAGWRSPAGARVSAVAFDFQDPATHPVAFDGAERVFLVRPPALSDVERWMFPAIDAASRAGVRQVVFLSLLGAERNRWVPHRAVEDHLRESRMAWTFLRPSFFMQNLCTTHGAEIRERGEILVPAGRGRTSFIDARDVADVAALVLTQPGHDSRAYDLTGAEALTYEEAAAILSRVLGRGIVYRRPGLVPFLFHMRRRGHPLPFVLVMAGIYTTARLGLAGRVTDDVSRLLHRPPRSFERFVQDYRNCWDRPAS